MADPDGLRVAYPLHPAGGNGYPLCLTGRLSVSGELLGPDGVVIHTRTIEDTARSRHHSGRTAQIVDGLAEIPDILGYHDLVQIARFPGPGPVRPLGFVHGWHDDDA